MQMFGLGAKDGMAGKIFINYRRDDALASAGRLHDRLVPVFGRTNLFLDVDHIPAGVDFVQHLEEQVAACDVFLAVIGPSWLEAKDETGRRRLDNPGDFVVVEITAALARDIRLIPVLLDGARMPRPEDLPDALKPLARRNAVEVRNTQFGRDADGLIAKIKGALEVHSKPQVNRAPLWAAAAIALSAAGYVLLGVMGGPVWVPWERPSPLPKVAVGLPPAKPAPQPDSQAASSEARQREDIFAKLVATGKRAQLEGFAAAYPAFKTRVAAVLAERDRCNRSAQSVVSQGTIQFERESATIDPVSKPTLDQLIRTISGCPTVRIVIEGHTDDQGSPDRNLPLSERRAQALLDYFVRGGIDPSRLTAIGYGGTRPVAENVSPAGRAKNNRVSFDFKAE